MKCDLQNVIEMVRVIKYSEKYDKAVRHIFGKTLICRELEAAVKTAKSHRFDCVTLDGDKVASRGVLTGELILITINLLLLTSFSITFCC
jgi:structural maintenance of chromosome 3 (chondroitin sulfate proteoglycan 6)